MPRPSNSMENMESEGFKVFNGLDQNLSDEEQLAKKMTASCEGLSFRGGKLSTNQFGYGCLPFNWTKSNQRGYGIVPSTDLGKFFTVVAKDDGAGSLTANTHLQSLFDFTSTSIDTHKPRLLVSSGILNGVVVTADGNSMRKYYQTTIADDLSVLPLAPTFSADSGTGITGTYLYRVTLLDVNLNETGGGTVSASHTVTNGTVNLTLNLTGYVTNPVTQWRYVRFFRTTNGGSTYYFLNQQTLIGGTTTYTYADSTSDATLTGAGSYQLINPTPAPAGFYADVVIVDDNRVIAIATTESGTYYPNRVRWTVLTDSSDTSTGNVNSWRANDFEDIQNDPINENIGGYPGLGGRTYVFAKNGTWSMVGTGDIDKPFTFQQIDSTYGLYHHSIDNAGGFLIGRTRDGLATFNGSTLKPLGTELSKFFSNCVSVKGDSGAYDFKTKRYYMGVCDGILSGSYVFSSVAIQELMTVYRNCVVCFDLKENKFEIMSGVFLQVLKNLQDSNGEFNIFALGASNDIHIIMNNSMTGVNYSEKCAVINPQQVTVSMTGMATNAIAGRIASFPIYINSDSSKIIFCDYTTPILGSGATSVVFGTAIVVGAAATCLPIVTGGTEYYLFLMDAAYGTATGSSAGKLDDNGTNFFLSSLLKNFGTSYADSSAQSWTRSNCGFDGITIDDFNTITTNSGTISSVPYTIDCRKFLNLSFSFPKMDYNFFKTPLFGTDSTFNTKSFRYVWLNVRGSGVLRIRTIVDNNTVENQTLFYTLSDRRKWVMARIDLNGTTGDTMSIEVGMKRGAGEFECQEISLFWRNLGRLRNA